MTKTIIIGSNHAGIAAANTLLDNYPDQEIVMIDKNSDMSYLGCGTALWIGRQIDSYEDLFYIKKEDLEFKGVKVYMETTVSKINFASKKVYCNLPDGTLLVENYEKLILATGSVPIEINIPGADLNNIYSLKLFRDGQNVDKLLDKQGICNVAVIGAGYIGVEIAEAIRRRNKNVLLFDTAKNSLSGYYDNEFTDKMDENLISHGIDTHFNERVKEYEGVNKVESVVTDKGKYSVDLVINAVGFLPNSTLGMNYLELYKNGAYIVDKHQQTSDSSVYAVGDCATIYSNALDKTTYIALATNAVRSGIIAGHNVGGTKLDATGAQGSNGISIFGLNMFSTGMSVKSAKKNGFDVLYTDFEDMQKPKFMKDNAKVKIRIVYDSKSRRILGAQLCSSADISMGIHMFSLAIEQKVTIDQLKLLDIFFLPHFNQPYNYITMAALGAK